MTAVLDNPVVIDEASVEGAAAPVVNTLKAKALFTVTDRKSKGDRDRFRTVVKFA